MSDLYGKLNLIEDKIEYFKGPLLDSVENGYIFISNGMNLSSFHIMKSIVPFLNPLLTKDLLLPGYCLDKPINIHDNFFFISYLNDSEDLERNSFTEELERKLIKIKYPELRKDEIKIILEQKKINFLGYRNEYFKVFDYQLIIDFMLEYNNFIEKEKLVLLKWTLRDIDKIYKRAYK